LLPEASRHAAQGRRVPHAAIRPEKMRGSESGTGRGARRARSGERSWHAPPAGAQAVGQLDVLARAGSADSARGDALRTGAPLAQLVADAGWHRCSARVSTPGGAGGAGLAVWEAKAGGGWWGPSSAALEGDARYLDVRFEDGVYARLPRELSAFGGGEVWFEVGCLRSAALATGGFTGPLAGGLGGLGRGGAGSAFGGFGSAGARAAAASPAAAPSAARPASGGLHRLLALGDMARGEIHTLCHEVFTE